jgi:hypothetical protein
MKRRGAALVLLATLALGTVFAAEDPSNPPGPAPADPGTARRKEKALQAVKLLGYRELALDLCRKTFKNLAEQGRNLPDDIAEQFREVADFEALEAAVAEAYAGVYSEKTLDGLNDFLRSAEGKEFAGIRGRFADFAEPHLLAWFTETFFESQGITAKVAAMNEKTVIASLRNLANCQEQMRLSGLVDCDNDGRGEFGFLLEMTGAARRRTAAGAVALAANDFSRTGRRVMPPLLSPSLAGVDASGHVAKDGYQFRIYLPDSGSPAGWVGERGPGRTPGLLGGTGKVGTESSETTWCAYAWPEKAGVTGNRVFFVNADGVVLETANAGGKYAGRQRPVPGGAAFRGAGITSPVAIGTSGRDGDVWRVVP